MTDPRPEIAAFVQDTPWACARIAPLAGDASLRRYWRLTLSDKTAVLMDAPPNTGETTGPFIQIASHLQTLGYSSPRLLKTSAASGLILMEDLGDTLFARKIVEKPDIEARLYEAAVDLLANLAQQPVPDGVPTYDGGIMSEKAGMASTWYAGSSNDTEISQAMRAALEPLENAQTVLALRDFHAENLIWLPDRCGLARVGLLDFQDAARAPLGYDLISLLFDARRDVSPALVAPLMQRYAKACGLPLEDLTQTCAILGAQRSLRILGTFARLSLHFGKPSYVDLIPRVWSQLETSLAHPSLNTLAKVCLATLPPPSANHLNDLRARCGTIPTL